MSLACPSDLVLESYLRHPNTTPCGPHVAVCMECVQRLSRMRQDGQQFEAHVFPATLDHVLAKSHRRFRFPMRWLWILPAGAAVTAGVVFFPVVTTPKADAPPANYEGVKGDFFSVFVHRPEGAGAVSEGAEVPAAGVLRFEVHPPQGCWVSVVSIDESGHVSKLFPARGESAKVPVAGELPGGAALDGIAGPERLFAFCSPTAMPFSQVQMALQSTIKPGKHAVRSAHLVHGLPHDVLQDTVLLEKKL